MTGSSPDAASLTNSDTAALINTDTAARAVSPGPDGRPLSHAGRGALAGLLSLATIVLALVGLGVATYLSVVHFAHQPIACNGIGDCEYVNSTKYAKVAGVPVALMGAASYATMALLVAAAWLRRDAMLLLAAWTMAAASFAFSMYLTYVELWVIDAICVYCVVSATTMTALFAVLSALAWLRRDEILGENDQ